MMTKEELLLGFADVVRKDDWDQPATYFYPLGFNCQKVDRYVADASDKGYEQYLVHRVEPLPGQHENFRPFNFIISYCGGRWEDAGVALFDATPKQVTRYDIGENYVDKLWDMELEGD